MEVRPGYQLTEIGVIPDDWAVRPLSEHFKIYAGGDAPKHSLSNTQSHAHPYPIFANALSNRGLYGYTAERRSTGDSVTITARGYLGHAEYRSSPFFPIVRLLVLEPTGELDARFSAYAINETVEFAFESTGVPQLTAPQVGKYRIGAPQSREEQRTIAAALADVDALLVGLDRLIAKKRDLKQAAMQRLLTGQTRLPGFHGEWKPRRLGELCAMKSGEGITSRFIDEVSQFPCYGGNGLRGFTTRFTHEGHYCLIGRVGALCGNVIRVAGKFFASEHAIVVTAFETVDVGWLTLALGTLGLNGRAESSAQPVLTVTKLLPLEVTTPSSKREQSAVAAVIYDMDAELTALEARRHKTRALKQGMMQELLTGRIRLV